MPGIVTLKGALRVGFLPLDGTFCAGEELHYHPNEVTVLES